MSQATELTNEQLMAIAGPPAIRTQAPARAPQQASAQPAAPRAPVTPTRQFQAPVAGRQTSGFGPRTAPRPGASTQHMGIDLAAGPGDPVGAAGDGEVIFAGQQGGYGNRVILRHADGTQTTYSHLSNIGVGVGDRLGAGQPIGAAGATGNVTGPHVHFEVMDSSGQFVNPADWMGPVEAAQASAPAQDYASLSDEDLAAIAAGTDQGASVEPIAVEIDQGVQNVNGRAIRAGGPDDGQDLGPWDQYQADQRKSQQEREALAQRREDPVYQAEYARAQGGAENVPDGVAAMLAGQTLGGKGIVPWLTGAVSYVDGAMRGVDPGLASQAGRDATRDTMDSFARENPGQNLGYQLLGGLLTPGLKGAGDYVAGAQGAERLGRAAGVGAGQGMVSGLLNSSGDAGQRAADVFTGGVVGGAAMGVLDSTAQRAFGAATRAGAGAASPARLLSREGVSLTPGQMAQDIPVIGPMLRGLEDGASSIPFVGSPIAGARQQSVETFNRAAINQALKPIGAKLPNGTRPGYDAVQFAQDTVSREYDRVLANTQFVPDTAFYNRLGASINETLTSAGVPQAGTLSRQINDRVFRSLGAFNDPINGQQFKALESEFGTLAANSLESTDGASRALGRAYQQVQEALRAGLRDQNPQAAADLRAVNGSYARLMRIEQASGSSASQATEGVFSPTQLGVAVAQRGSRRSSARGDALLQDLAVAGRGVIPSRTGDSGTATRGAITGLLAAGASGVPLAGGLAIPVIATSVAYSRPAQAAINAIYRASDSAQAMEALGQLQRLAGRNPALRPYYEEALRHVLPGQEQPAPPSGLLPSPASQTRPATPPSPAGLLAPR